MNNNPEDDDNRVDDLEVEYENDCNEADDSYGSEDRNG
jgi:hypothetical protein